MDKNNQESIENQGTTLELSGTTAVMKTDKFNDGYFQLHSLVVNKGEKIPSRNGNTLELLNFKTTITNPIARCVGGKERNINIFFLLAEAIWIWAGKRDVEFLEAFNKQMAEYSDNGKVFHAPYGWRLRRYGVPSEIDLNDSNKHALMHDSIDQIKVAISLLAENQDTRQVVAQIWNPEFDLGVASKDIPCNDMLMFKVREGKLNITIQNRSNDLDWGLATNVFQFSWILEVMANIIGIGVGTQTHNSDSLHLYDWNPLTTKIEDNQSEISLYDSAITPLIDFDFQDVHNVEERLSIVDYWMNAIIDNLTIIIRGGKCSDETFKDKLFAFSEFLYLVYNMLEIYVLYKNKIYSRYTAMMHLSQLNIMQSAFKSDYLILALNFFVIRFEKSNKGTEEDEKTVNLITDIRQRIDANIGKY